MSSPLALSPLIVLHPALSRQIEASSKSDERSLFFALVPPMIVLIPCPAIRAFSPPMLRGSRSAGMGKEHFLLIHPSKRCQKRVFTAEKELVAGIAVRLDSWPGLNAMTFNPGTPGNIES